MRVCNDVCKIEDIWGKLKPLPSPPKHPIGGILAYEGGETAQPVPQLAGVTCLKFPQVNRSTLAGDLHSKRLHIFQNRFHIIIICLLLSNPTHANSSSN